MSERDNRRLAAEKQALKDASAALRDVAEATPKGRTRTLLLSYSGNLGGLAKTLDRSAQLVG